MEAFLSSKLLDVPPEIKNTLTLAEYKQTLDFKLRGMDLFSLCETQLKSKLSREKKVKLKSLKNTENEEIKAKINSDIKELESFLASMQNAQSFYDEILKIFLKDTIKKRVGALSVGKNEK